MGNILYTRRPPYYLRMFKCLLMQMSYLPIRIEKQGDLRDFGRGMVFRDRLLGIFQKLLIYWNFPTQPYL